MALNDITLYDSGSVMQGAKRFKVAAGGSRAAAIKAGELVFKPVGNTNGKYVTAWMPALTATALKPNLASWLTTHTIAGLAMSNSTETKTAAGVVDVMPNLPGTTYLVAPNVAATWDTQAEYDALVGSRILLDYSATGVITALASDSANNGAVVEPLDVQLYPAKVRFSLRQALNYFA
jgi:hypothetical protein